MKLPALPVEAPTLWPQLSTRVRSLAITARVGRILGIAFTVCFLTGLLSHLQYHPLSWLPTSAFPFWGYRVTQGLHVITGIACIPLILVKLWSVYPKLFSWPPFGGILDGLERLSILVFVSTALLELGTGLVNVLGWYPWPWDFTRVHYWLAFVIIGSLLLHIAIKLPLIKQGLATRLTEPATTEPATTEPATTEPASTEPASTENGTPSGGISRRGALITAGVGVGLVVATTAGQTLRPLEPIALFAPRRPKDGPNGVPINRTAQDMDVVQSAQAPTYSLRVTGPRPFELDLAAIEALTVHERTLPISCVEGWSAGAVWRGPKLYDLVRRAGGDANSIVQVTSLQKSVSPERSTRIQGEQMREALLATHINGVRLPLDHGYPIRLIAPDRAGALNTKWLTLIEVR